MDPILLPPGYGFQKLTAADLRAHGSLLDILHVWEPPRRRGPRRYVVGVDVSDGLGQERSTIEVIRVGTIEEPAEQVAEFVTSSVTPMTLAFIACTIGQWYRDSDGVEALMAVECNNHGLSVQNTMQLHLGYSNFYIWEYYDAADPSARISTKIGWYTTPRTRPMLLDKLYDGLTTVDPVSGNRDLVTHSSLLHEELKDFQTVGALWEAEHARGATDDCIFGVAIAHYCAWKLQGGETEPLEERRRRRSEQKAQLAKVAGQTQKPDYRNTVATADDQNRGLPNSEDAPDVEDRLADFRASDDSMYGNDGFGW